MKSILSKFTSNPKSLFLMDAIGAIVSAFSLGIVLVKMNHLIGLPEEVLINLSTVACLFALYSFWCFRFLTQNFVTFIKIIASANLIYCIVSICILFIYRDELLPLGYIYFIVEKIIVLTLVYLEFKTANKLKTNN